MLLSKELVIEYHEMAKFIHSSGRLRPRRLGGNCLCTQAIRIVLRKYLDLHNNENIAKSSCFCSTTFFVITFVLQLLVPSSTHK